MIKKKKQFTLKIFAEQKNDPNISTLDVKLNPKTGLLE